jgi:hypothetical protein
MASSGSLRDPDPTMPLELDVRIHHDDRPPGALAHGAIKPSDIERVRGDVARAEQCVAGTAAPAARARGGCAGSRRSRVNPIGHDPAVVR